MRNRAVASRYARALLESAEQAGVLGAVAESFDDVMKIVDDKPELLRFLSGPHVAEDKKLDLLRTVFGDRIEKTLSLFFRLLVEKQRMDSLVEIHVEFQEQVEIRQGLLRALVTTAVPLPEDLEIQLKEKLSALTGKQIVLRKNVDPAVQGGACVTMGDQVIDGTIRTNLTRLRAQLSQADVRV
jgi:F-type H+-transporting ATPase subunit delta